MTTLALNTLGARTTPKEARAPEPPLTELLSELRRYPEFDLDTLAYHAQQSDATARDGYWHASINEARSLLEALIVSMIRAAACNNASAALHNRTAFRTCRRILCEAGVLDADENELLQHVYAIASAKGGHHGASDQAWSALARDFVRTTVRHLIARYAHWKASGPRMPPSATADHERCQTAWNAMLRAIRALCTRRPANTSRR